MQSDEDEQFKVWLTHTLNIRQGSTPQAEVVVQTD